MPSINFGSPEMDDNSSYMEKVFQLNTLFNSNTDYALETYLKKIQNNFIYSSEIENSEKVPKEKINKTITPEEFNNIEKRVENDKRKIFSVKKIPAMNKIKRKRDYEGKQVNTKQRLYQEYNVRTKIARNFFNKYLIKKINKIIKKIKCPLYFEIFQENLVLNVATKIYIEHLNLTLEEIISYKKLYKVKNEGNNYQKYYHNLISLEKLKLDEFKYVREKTEINNILKKAFRDLFQDYLNSDEYHEVIEHMKNSDKKYDNDYIERYIEFSKNFLKNYKYKNIKGQFQTLK